jgi:hypothetical protein
MADGAKHPKDPGQAHPSRRAVLGTVMGAAGAAVLGTFASALVESPARAAGNAFRWCSRCQSLWYISGGSNGHCPVFHLWDHSHYQDRSWHFLLKRYSIDDAELGRWLWNWCLTCKALYVVDWGGNVCPNGEGGRHTATWPEYVVDQPREWWFHRYERAQEGWYCCVRCSEMFYPGYGLEATHCPAGGAHDSRGSNEYRLPY